METAALRFGGASSVGRAALLGAMVASSWAAYETKLLIYSIQLASK